MALFSISGNVGGATGSGATVQLVSDRGDVNQSAICDGSGNFTFSNLADQRTYNLSVLTTGVATTVVRAKQSVTLNGGNVTGVNFNIVNLNSSNLPPTQDF